MSTGKHTRSVRLTQDVNDRLQALCDHLGVNVNAYLIGEIGKAVSRDEMVFKAQQNQAEMFASLSTMIEDQKEG